MNLSITNTELSAVQGLLGIVDNTLKDLSVDARFWFAQEVAKMCKNDITCKQAEMRQLPTLAEALRRASLKTIKPEGSS